ncbi:MAG: hypothetical protein A2Z81_00050 [Omnitrophica WOR_2 bacterium GWA2_45_18]|nr:MAG: hypothetical protein A2Z81_00050 [Omnitrophica WOR_2 bacterium GWA2_45_18]
MFFAIFIPATMFQLSTALINKFSQYKKQVYAAYLISLVFGFLDITTPYIVLGVRPRAIFPYWPSPGLLYVPFLFFFFVIVIYAHILMFKHYIKLTGIERNKIKYVFLGTAIAFSGGSTNYFLWFDIPVLPYGNLLVSVYGVLVAYSIIKYRLMDITLAITRAGIFVCVYTLVLGIPFGVGIKYLGTGLWLMPVSLMAVCATVGPFIYLYIQKKAEERLLVEQHQYQATLRRASLGMGRVKDLKKLLDLIVHVITRTVRIEHTEIYLLHDESGKYVLKALKGKRPFDPSTRPAAMAAGLPRDHTPETEKPDAAGMAQGLPGSRLSVLPGDSALIEYLKRTGEAVLFEEMRQKAQDYQDVRLKEIISAMTLLDGALVVPSFLEDRMIAVIVLGKKKSDKIYTHDDLVVFSILSNQAALAIENALFYQDAQKKNEQLFRAEKMATIGTMADGLSHQINNRLHAMGFIASDVMDTIKLKKKESLPEDTKTLLSDIEHSLARIQDNVKRGGEIVEGLLKYTRKGDQGFTAVQLCKLVDAALEMAQFKIRLSEIDFVKNYNEHTPRVRGNFTQLQEVFFNIIDNSYDAMMQRKTELKEPGFRPTIEISAMRVAKNLEITIKDNGIGVKKEDADKLFAPFFTTKLSSKKGTGLGLYVIRKLIEENHGGKVIFTSEYQHGSQTRLLLPAASEGETKD